MNTETPDSVAELLKLQQEEWDRRTEKVQSSFLLGRTISRVIACLPVILMIVIAYYQVNLFFWSGWGSLEHQIAFALFIPQIGCVGAGFAVYLVLRGLIEAVRGIALKRIGLRPREATLPEPQVDADASLLSDGSWKVLAEGREFIARVLPSDDMSLRSHTRIEFTEQGGEPQVVNGSPKARTVKSMVEQAIAKVM